MTCAVTHGARRRGFVLRRREIPGHRIPGVVEEAAESLRLMHRIDVKIRTLSEGMRQRIGIAQAILNTPELLILDEPTVGLDFESQAELVSAMLGVAREGCVVVSTHQLEDLREIASTATALDRGKAVLHGSLADMPARYLGRHPRR